TNKDGQGCSRAVSLPLHAFSRAERQPLKQRVPCSAKESGASVLREGKDMKYICTRFLVIICVAIMAAPVLGQNPGSSAPRTRTSRQNYPADPTDLEDDSFKGFNEYEHFRGMINSSGSLIKLDSTLGYDFNRYAGVFVGIPLYFASDSTNTPG